MNKNDLIIKLNKIVYPIVENTGYELYYLEFVKEDNENYLRIYIDSENGISLDDCEKVSRAVSSVLDTEDPITSRYFLEVSSPGIYRILYTDEHLKKALNKKVDIFLKKSINSKKKYEGILSEFNDSYIKIINDNTETEFDRKNISKINLNGEE